MLKNEFIEHLEQNIIPYWNKMKDTEHGGFYGYTDFDGKTDKKAEKGVILHSRILWFYSAAYNLLGKPELLEMAEHTYKFLTGACTDKEYGGVYWSVSYDGKPADTTKHTYCQGFAIYALSEYYKASGNPDALDKAYELYKVIEARSRDEGGYLEALKRDFSPESNEKLSENGVIATRTMNTLLHVFEAYTVLYEAGKCTAVADSIKKIFAIVKDKIYNPEYKICDCFFDADYNSLIHVESYGHNIETAWLLQRGCDVLGDADVSAQMLPVIDALAERAFTNGIDHAAGAMKCELAVDEENTERVWWVQAESVVGFYDAYARTPEKKEYLEIAKRIWSYIQNNSVRSDGEWYWTVFPDGTPDESRPMVSPWKCPYHNGRMCIEMARRLPK